MELGREFLRGVRWSGLASVSTHIVLFFGSVLLARLLYPKDFGAVAAATVAYWVLITLAGTGLAAAIIQRKELDDRHIHSAFWVVTGLGASLSVVLLACAPWVGELFNDPRVADVAVMISALVLLTALASVPRGLLYRRLEFRAIAVIDTVCTLISTTASCLMALAGFGIASLAGGLILRGVLLTSLLWGVAGFRPRLLFSFSALGEMLPFTLPLLAGGLVGLVGERADVFLVGSVLGSRSLGFYNKAQNIIRLLGTQLANAVQTTGLATLSRTQDDIDRLRRSYLRIVKVASAVAFPALTGLFVVAPSFVIALYSDRWADSIPLVRILAPAGAFWTLATITSPVILSLGRSGLLLVWSTVQTAALIALVIAGLGHGLVGVAVAIAVHYVFSCLVLHGMVLRLVRCRVIELLRVVWAPFIASGIMLSALWPLQEALQPETGPWVILGIQIPTGVAIYLITVFLLQRSQLKETLRAIRELAALPPPSVKS